MKTHREIVTEAQRLEESARRGASEQRRGLAGDASVGDAFWVLFSFPQSQFHSRVGDGDESEPIHTHRRVRWIEAAMKGDVLEYRLVQDEIEMNATGWTVREVTPVLMCTSDSALEVLEEGYDLVEQERLSELLVPYMERAEANEFVETVEPHVVEEIEAIVDAGSLLPASRLHARADIVKLLDGRLEPDEFITAAISRQRECERVSEEMTERVGERIAMGAP
jgi:hypothetical protein